MKNPTKLTTEAAQAAALFTIFNLVPDDQNPTTNTLSQPDPPPIKPHTTTFHHFRKLPLELQCAVWEHTWPLPRLICMSFHEDQNPTHKPTDLVATDLGCFDGPLATICRAPVALHICQESRRYTLRRYHTVRHTICKSKSEDVTLYVNPSRDLLWSDATMMDQLQASEDLGARMTRQLEQIEMLFVEEDEWMAYRESGSLLRCVAPFKGLKMVLVLLDHRPEGDFGEVDVVDQKDDRDHRTEGVGDREVEVVEHNLNVQLSYAKLQGRADELRTEYTQMLRGQKVERRHIYCVDKAAHFH